MALLSWGLDRPTATSILIILLLISSWLFWKYKRDRRERVSRLVQSRWRNSVNASTELVGSLDLLIDDGPFQLVIVGGDGLHELLAPNSKWFSALARWARKGCEIRYLLMKPNSLGVATYKDLLTDPAVAPNFHLYVIGPEILKTVANDGNDGERIAFFTTFHPTLLRRLRHPDDESIATPVAMWLEGVHFEGTPLAFSVEFVGPAQVKSDNRFDFLWSELERLLAAYFKEVTSARLEAILEELSAHSLPPWTPKRTSRRRLWGRKELSTQP